MVQYVRFWLFDTMYPVGPSIEVCLGEVGSAKGKAGITCEAVVERQRWNFRTLRLAAKGVA